MRLIFLISLPRSGSTLIQRVLSNHPEIRTASETWFFLPIFYALRKYGAISEYDQGEASRGIADLIDLLPRKLEDYHSSISDFSTSIFNKCSQGEKYFLEKTPRNYLIIKELMACFPEAKFIFLFRNPLAIFTSILKRWSNGKLYFPHQFIDLHEGTKLISEGFVSSSNSMKINYEDFLINTEENLSKIFDFLEIERVQNLGNDIKDSQLAGRLGDKSEFRNLNRISADPINSWKHFIKTLHRKHFFINYLNKLPAKYFEVSGYDKSGMIKDLKTTRVYRLFYLSDLFSLFLTRFIRLASPWLWVRRYRDHKINGKDMLSYR